MSIHTNTSVPSMSGSPRGRFGRNVLVGAAGSVVLAAAIGGGLWSRSDRNESASPAISAAAAVQPPSGPSLASSLATAGYTPHTVYIVGSEEQAALVRAGINDANAIRSTANEPPLLDEVFVAGSDADADALGSAETAANEILAAQYGVENRIVDLRW